LTNIFQRGWNHQLDELVMIFESGALVVAEKRKAPPAKHRDVRRFDSRDNAELHSQNDRTV